MIDISSARCNAIYFKSQKKKLWYRLTRSNWLLLDYKCGSRKEVRGVGVCEKLFEMVIYAIILYLCQCMFYLAHVLLNLRAFIQDVMERMWKMQRWRIDCFFFFFFLSTHKIKCCLHSCRQSRRAGRCGRKHRLRNGVIQGSHWASISGKQNGTTDAFPLNTNSIKKGDMRGLGYTVVNVLQSPGPKMTVSWHLNWPVFCK